MSCAKKPTCYNPVPKEKWANGEIVRRVRGTGGGDRCHVDYPVSTNTAPVPAFKTLLHATVSENSFFGTADITDFYLGSPMPSPEYMIMYTSLFTPELLLDLGITPFLQTDSKGREFFYAQVDRALPGFR